MLELIAAAALALVPAEAPADQADKSFDIQRTPGGNEWGQAESGQVPPMAGDPLPPRGLKMRSSTLDAPEMQFSLAARGPVILLGAFGGRYSGMPRLVHVGLIWAI